MTRFGRTVWIKKEGPAALCIYLVDMNDPVLDPPRGAQVVILQRGAPSREVVELCRERIGYHVIRPGQERWVLDRLIFPVAERIPLRHIKGRSPALFSLPLSDTTSSCLGCPRRGQDVHREGELVNRVRNHKFLPAQRLAHGEFAAWKTSIGVDFLDVYGDSGTKFQLWDVAGSDRFPSRLFSVFARGAQAVFVVTSVEQAPDFPLVHAWRSKAPGLPALLVVNKADLGLVVRPDDLPKGDFVGTYNVSAKSGEGFSALLAHCERVAVRLEEEQAVRLEEEEVKNGCC